MAVNPTSSASITNMDASPSVKVSALQDHGVLRECVGTLQATSGDSTGSIYRFCRIPSRARVSQVLISFDGAATPGAADIGLALGTGASGWGAGKAAGGLTRVGGKID